MNIYKKYFKQKRDKGVPVLIIVISILLGFYYHQKRWIAAYDQTYDYLISRYTLYWDIYNKHTPKEFRISTILALSEAEFGMPDIYGELKSYDLIDVNSSLTASLQKRRFRLVDSKTVYYDTEEWYKTKKL